MYLTIPVMTRKSNTVEEENLRIVGTFLVDTGSEVSAITKNTATLLQLPEEATEYVELGGITETREWLPVVEVELSIGDYIVNPCKVVVLNNMDLIRGAEVAGLLGMDIISKFKWTIDGLVLELVGEA